MRAECRPRKLLHITQQARDYIAEADEHAAECVKVALTVLEDPESHRASWDDFVFESISREDRMYYVMANAHVVVWQPMGDAPGNFAVFYIGPASHWV